MADPPSDSSQSASKATPVCLEDGYLLERQILSTAMDAAEYEVRLSVLGVAGIVVNPPKTPANKKGKSRKHRKNSVLKDPSKISAAVALSRKNQQDTIVSPLSKPFNQASRESKTDRYVAIWSSSDNASEADPTFKFQTHLRSIDLEQPADAGTSCDTPKSHENVDLIVALSEDSEFSDKALPVGMASLSLSSHLYRRGKHIVDLPLLPIKNKGIHEGKEQLNQNVITLSESSKMKESASRRKGLRNPFTKKCTPGIFEGKKVSLEQQRVFHDIYKIDPSGDSIIRVQLEVLHKITCETTQRTSAHSHLQSKPLTVRSKHSFQSSATPVHQNVASSDELSYSSFEGGDDYVTSVEVTTKSSYVGEKEKYRDTVRIQFSNGREARIFPSEVSRKITENQEMANVNTSIPKQNSSAVLDALLPSVSVSEQELAVDTPSWPSLNESISESKEEIITTQSYDSQTKSAISFAEDLEEKEEKPSESPPGIFTNGCNGVMTAYMKEFGGDDLTVGDRTFYTRHGGTTLGNNTFETLQSIDFWTIDGWCTVGKELLNGEIPNVYEGKSVVSEADDSLERRILGWKRHLRRMKSEAATEEMLSQGRGTFDDTTVSDGDSQSNPAAVSLMRQTRTNDSTNNTFDTHSSVQSAKPSTNKSDKNHGSPARVDSIGQIQKDEAKTSSSVLDQQKTPNISQRVAGMFSWQRAPSTPNEVQYEPFGKDGDVPRVVGKDIERTDSCGDITEITQDVVLNGNGATRLLRSDKVPLMNGALTGCFCPNHPDDYSLMSLAAKTNDENYFAEYDDYSFVAPTTSVGPEEGSSSSSRAEI